MIVLISRDCEIRRDYGTNKVFATFEKYSGVAPEIDPRLQLPSH
jgi:hypothetical protein